MSVHLDVLENAYFIRVLIFSYHSVLLFPELCSKFQLHILISDMSTDLI